MKFQKFPRSGIVFTKEEMKLLRSLNDPWKIQDFIDRLPANYEKNGVTLKSVRETIKDPTVHCIEAALLAACAFWVNGEAPLLLDMRAIRDFDHVIAVFQRNGMWGAVSKSNYPVLRFRDPIYRSPRELILSYFHEYTNLSGEKSLRSYSRPIDISRVDPSWWVTGGRECWDIGALLDDAKHYDITPRHLLPKLRKLDTFTKRVTLTRQFP